ncbi:MAG: ATP-binding protein [Victivallales bacterium]|nr:ATP-binding protein [Victivallales bacterium]
MEKLIGRTRECDELRRVVESARSEFVVIYGRRRVGKTFLVRSFFSGNYDFHYVGAHNMKTRQQLQNFRKELIRYSGNTSLPELESWMDAFEHLESYLEGLDSSRRKVIFMDEMPWIDAKHSDFIMALEYFWNSWVSNRDDIVFIACGSATSWMADKLIENQGGLHNRITRQIYLRPFTLHECQEYLQAKGIDWDMRQVMQCYMILGGVPFYWSLLEPQLSLPQNIDRLCFRRDGILANEFDELYNALFSNAGRYISIVRALADKHSGMTRDELSHSTSISGGNLSKILRNLERCDFISSYSQFGNKSKLLIYRLSDFYTIFYLKFMNDARTYDEDFWSHHFMDSSVAVWQGYSFELVCMAHLQQIKKALGISGISTKVSSWRYVPRESANNDLPSKGAQIDMLISRADKIIHLCEIKFSQGAFAISAEYRRHLDERMEIFRQVTGVRHGLVHTFITPEGLAKNMHSSNVHSEVTARDLFTE